ncbi:MAG: TetR/AcrR family transcriptional regulator [Micromonosporaceae bacterium]
MPRQKQRTPELRDRVLGVAVETLTTDGIPGLTARRVAQEAQTSTPAVYELFGDKAGLIRAIFFEGFRMLRRHLEQAVRSDDERTALLQTIAAFRTFVRDSPVLARVMFERPFADFDPGPEDIAAGASVREFILDQVRRCVGARVLAGDPADIAHVLIGLAQGLAAQEAAGWLGTSRASVSRRWSLGVEAVLDGLRPRGEHARG